jgi:hypothetical protein
VLLAVYEIIVIGSAHATRSYKQNRGKSSNIISNSCQFGLHKHGTVVTNFLFIRGKKQTRFSASAFTTVEILILYSAVQADKQLIFIRVNWSIPFRYLVSISVKSYVISKTPIFSFSSMSYL